LVEEPLLKSPVVFFVLVNKNWDWNVGNQNPAFGGWLVSYAGVNVAKAEVKWPRAFVPTMLGEMGLVRAQNNG
jgi:hypothetical protein